MQGPHGWHRGDASIIRNGEFGQIREGDQVDAGQPFVTDCGPQLDGSQRYRQPGGRRETTPGHEGRGPPGRVSRYRIARNLVGIGAMSKTSTFRARFVGEIPVRLKMEKTDPRVIPDLTGSAEIILGSKATPDFAALVGIRRGTAVPSYSFKVPEGWIRKKVEPGLPSFTRWRSVPDCKKGTWWHCEPIQRLPAVAPAA